MQPSMAEGASEGAASEECYTEHSILYMLCRAAKQG